MDADSEAMPCFLNVTLKEEHEGIDICIEESKYDYNKGEYIEVSDIKEECEDNFEKYYQSDICQTIIENVNDLIQTTYNVKDEQENKISKSEDTIPYDNILTDCENGMYGQTESMLQSSLRFHDYHTIRAQEGTNQNEESDLLNKGDTNSVHLKKINVANERNQGHCSSKKRFRNRRFKKRPEGFLLYKCFKCKEKFGSKNQISEHLKVIHSIEKYECYECGKCFLRKGHLYIHILVHLNATKHMCPKCGKSFIYKSACDAHINTHNSGERVKYTCEKCHRHFLSKRSLDMHFVTLCGRKICFCKEDDVILVQTSSIEEDRVKFNCDICNICFTNKNLLHKHLQTHKGIKHFLCMQCGKCFAQENHLMCHLLHHRGIKDYVCPECGKSFFYENHLNRHLLTHSGIKNFLCVKCGKSFTQKANLSTHLNTHDRTKSYGCVKCGKLFTAKANCERHMLTHDDTRYRCHKCGKVYKNKESFEKHVLGHKDVEENTELSYSSMPVNFSVI